MCCKMDDPQLKRVWERDTRHLVDKYNASYAVYIEQRPGIIDRFLSFFSAYELQVNQRSIPNRKAFLDAYKQMYNALYPFLAIDYVLDEPDPFFLWKRTEEAVRKERRVDQHEVHDGLAKIFEHEPIDKVYHFKFCNGLYKKLEQARDQHDHIVVFQKEHRALYDGNEPLLFLLEDQALNLMDPVVAYDQARLLPLKEKLKTLEGVLR
jgi:hypothetical protein